MNDFGGLEVLYVMLFLSLVTGRPWLLRDAESIHDESFYHAAVSIPGTVQPSDNLPDVHRYSGRDAFKSTFEGLAGISGTRDASTDRAQTSVRGDPINVLQTVWRPLNASSTTTISHNSATINVPMSIVDATYSGTAQASTLLGGAECAPCCAEEGGSSGGGSGEAAAASSSSAAAAEDDGLEGEFEGELCWICCNGARDAVLLECGHGGICYGCAVKCARKRPPLCPMCRQRITRVVQLDEGKEEVVDGEVVVSLRA